MRNFLEVSLVLNMSFFGCRSDRSCFAVKKNTKRSHDHVNKSNLALPGVSVQLSSISAAACMAGCFTNGNRAEPQKCCGVPVSGKHNTLDQTLFD